MAKVTITFEDLDEGVRVQIASEPGFPGPAATPEEQASLTQAQQMGIRMSELLNEELEEYGEEHEHGPDCDHDHDHDHA